MRRDPLAQPEEAIRRLYAYVAYRIGDGAEAEDVVSETIERALRYRDSFDAGKGPAIAWLIGIAQRVLVEHSRDRWRVVVADVEQLAGTVDDDASRIEQTTDLRRAMATLDERSRDLLALRYGADLKAGDIGVLLGMTTNAVEVAVHRALSRLRSVLEQRGAAAEQRDSLEPGLAP